MIRFHMEWQDAPGVRDAVLARTWCRLVIEADDRLVTHAIHGPSGSVRGGVYGSAFPLCRWIVENWWFLLNESYRFREPYTSRDLGRAPRDREWVQRHSFLAAREGGALPDLTLHRDEQIIVARWMRDDAEADGVLRFIGEGEVRMALARAEDGMAEMVEAVLERLEGLETPEISALREDWAAVIGAGEQERELCQWSARLGIDALDPDELTDDSAAALSRLVAQLDTSLKDDFLDAEQLQTMQRDLQWLQDAAGHAATAGRAGHDQPNFTPIAANTAHEQGYECAAALREHLRLQDGQSVRQLDDVFHRLGWAQSPYKAVESDPDSPLEAVLTPNRAGAPVAVVGDIGRIGNRFRLARSLFMRHFGTAGRRLVTGAHTWRQRASRAFAAEFLAPSQGLRRRIGDRATPREIDQLADEYDVSAHVILRQIQNRRLAYH